MEPGKVSLLPITSQQPPSALQAGDIDIIIGGIFMVGSSRSSLCNHASTIY